MYTKAFKVSRQEKLLLAISILIYGSLAVFSYAYVDLNLTISQNPHFLKFVAFMQQLGYYHRPQATLIYVLLIALSFSFFIVNLFLFYKSKIKIKYLAIATSVNTLILVFAYPFLSSDLFNYMFDAKIITHYQQNPYTHKPLDFPQDEWLRFMRWVHRLSPYGPLWLIASTIPSLLGLGKFLLTAFAFKISIAIFHLINTYLVYKILQKINKDLANLGTAFYALNPLFLIEGVANSHNDAVLAAFFLGSIYFLIQGNSKLASAVLIAGALIKYIPILNIPWLIWYKMKNQKIEKLIILNLATMAIFTYLYSSFRITVPFVSSGSTQVQFQPWYLFWTIPYISLIPKPKYIILAIALAIGASLRYLPYLYNGDWTHPNTTTYMTIVTIVPAVICTLALTFLKRKN